MDSSALPGEHRRVLLTATVQSHIVQFHRPLARLLHDRGYEVHVAARNNLGEKNGLTLDFADRIFDLPFCRSPWGRENLNAYRALCRIIDEGQYAVIHCNTPVAGILTRMAARKARRAGTRVIYTAHGFYFYQGGPRRDWMLYYPLEKYFANHRTDLLLTINREDFDLARTRFSCPVGRIHGVGVSADRYHPVSPAEKESLRSTLGLPPGPDTPVILCTGELRPNKNQAMLLRAMPRVLTACPNCLLILAGNGPEETSLKALSHDLGLDGHVLFLGYSTRLQDYQQASDLAVSCSIREGLGLNLIEAMLTGHPVVATDNRGHRELIRDGENGFLVPLGDQVAMSDRILEVLDDPDLTGRMGQQGLAMGQAYTDEAVYRELEAFYFETEFEPEKGGHA